MATTITDAAGSDPIQIWQSNGAGTEKARITAAGNVGIGTTSPGAKLEIAGGDLKLGSGVSTANIATDDITKPMVFKLGSTEKVRIDQTTGNVGIGTASPGAKLEIAGGDLKLGSGVASANITTDDITKPMVFKLGSTEKVRIDASTGNVGIGTTSPVAGLDVQAGETAASGNAFGVRSKQTLTAAANNDALNALYIDPTFADAGKTGVTHNGLIVAAGNVGIGTTSPARLLHVNGIARYKVPAVQVSRSSVQSIPSNTETVISWPSTIFNNDNLHSDTINPSRLTASEAGIWAIGCNIIWAAGTVNGSRQVTIRKNGGSYIANILQVPIGISGMAVSTIFTLV